MRAGETAAIRADGEAVLTYRSFTSIVPLIGMVMAVIVLATGLAAVGFLFAEGRPVPAAIAAILSAAFAVLIAMLVPQTNVTLFHGSTPSLSIVQESNVGFPVVTYVIAAPDRKVIARIRRSIRSRFFRHRWKILVGEPHAVVGEAAEESLGRAWLRKIAGKFNARYESNIRIRYAESDAGWILRRPGSDGERNVLEINEHIDARIAVALATLVLGSEP